MRRSVEMQDYEEVLPRSEPCTQMKDPVTFFSTFDFDVNVFPWVDLDYTIVACVRDGKVNSIALSE